MTRSVTLPRSVFLTGGGAALAPAPKNKPLPGFMVCGPDAVWERCSLSETTRLNDLVAYLKALRKTH